MLTEGHRNQRGVGYQGDSRPLKKDTVEARMSTLFTDNMKLTPLHPPQTSSNPTVNKDVHLAMGVSPYVDSKAH